MITPSTSDDRLVAFRVHPVSQLADVLSEYLGIGRDFIAFSQFLSLAAGAMCAPVDLEIASDQVSADLLITKERSKLGPGSVETIDTYCQFRMCEQLEFRNTHVLHVRPNRSRLFGDILTCRSSSSSTNYWLPSVWTITLSLGPPNAFACLRLRANSSERSLHNFSSNYLNKTSRMDAVKLLREVIASICTRVKYPCQFEQRFVTSTVSPVLMIVFQNWLQTFTHLRQILENYRGNRLVTIGDYEAVRSFLINCPIVAPDRILSPDAIAFAKKIQLKIRNAQYQLSLPDLSTGGHKWFTRNQAAEWTGLCYSSAKKRLLELEDDGVIESTHHHDRRRQGQQIYSRFLDLQASPITWTNPFSAMPKLS